MSHNDFSVSFIIEKDKLGVTELKKFKLALSKKLKIPKEEILKFSYNRIDFTINPRSTDFAYLITTQAGLYNDTKFKVVETVIKAIWESLEPPPLFCVGDDYELYNGIRNATLKGTLPPLQLINIIGNIYIERIGEKNLLNTPAYRAEKLKNGVLLLLGPNPFDLRNKEKVEDYLRRFMK